MNHDEGSKNIYSLEQARKKRKKEEKKTESKSKPSSKAKASAASEMGLFQWLKFFAAFLLTGLLMRNCGMM